MALCTPYICTNIILAAAAPPTKKLKKEKKSKVEKAMEKTFDMFMKSQADAEERFQMREDETEERRSRASAANDADARADAAIKTILIAIWV